MGVVVPEYVVPESDRALHEIAVSANTEAVVRFARSVGSVEVVVISSTAPVYFTGDGLAATVKGSNCKVLFSGPNSSVIPVSAWSGAVVRIISAEDAVVSVLT